MAREQTAPTADRSKTPTLAARRPQDRNQTSLILQRMEQAPQTLRPADILHLQRSIGNRATGRLLQAKLKLGPAGDQYEQEADRVAQQVVHASRQPDVQRAGVDEDELQAKPLAAGISQVQRMNRYADVSYTRPEPRPAKKAFVASLPTPKIQRADMDEEEVQAKPNHGLEGGDVDTDVARSIQSAKGSGAPLHDGVRSSMEQGFGADFSGVRVHTGGQADALNRSLNARAFTTGNDIFFGKGQYNPGSTGGQELIAHELTHTVQQGAAGVQRDVIQRAIGFEFETGYKIEKKEKGKWVKLKKMDIVQNYDNNIDLTADERSSGDTAVELVLQPPVQESDEEKFVAALETFADVGNAFHELKAVKRYELSKFKGIIKGPKNYAVTPSSTGFLGNPQLTGGIAFDKLYQFLSTAGTKDGKHQDAKTYLDNRAEQMTPQLELVQNIQGSDELKGLVAMLVLYLKKGCEEGGMMNYAKLISAGFMARTDFGSMFNKLSDEERIPYMKNPDNFVNLVLQAAGHLSPEELVFKRGVRKTNQISDEGYNENAITEGTGLYITRKQWLTRITRGYDLLSSDNSPELKSDLEGLGALGGRTDRVGNDPAPREGSHDKGKGIILELRQMNGSATPDMFAKRALKIFKYIRALNRNEI